MPSIYIQLFIETIKFSLNGTSSEKLVYLLKTHKLDWQLVEQKASYHGITPILFAAFLQVDKSLIDSKFLEKITSDATNQSFFNLLAAQETVRFLSFLTTHNIQAVPFKGIIFVHELYGKKSLREGSDLDILVRREDAAKALKLLISEGDYHFTLPEKFLEKYTIDEIISQLLATKGYHEVGLERRQSLVHIDFHWDVYEDFYQYELPVNLLFDELKNKPFFGYSCPIPSKEALFWMLVIHHGGREVWTRLKYFCDLLMFCQTCGTEIDWKKIIIDAEKFKMKRIIITAFYCLETQFTIQVPGAIKTEFNTTKDLVKNSSRIINYWEISQNRNNSFTSKINSYSLYFSLQDDDYSYVRHLKHAFLKRSYPNPLEVDERIIIFPENYSILNFLGKLATALSIYIGLKKR